MKQLLLIIGAGHEQVPAIRMAREMGCRVLVTDRDPQAPGIAEADGFELVSTADKEGNLEVARRHGVHGVMTLGSETAVPVVARIASELGLPGISEDTALKATNKNTMREAFRQHGVPTPASRPVCSLPEAMEFVEKHGFPVVVKPSDCSGQRGTTRVDEAGALPAAIGDALRFATDGRAIVETFCEGPEINVTAAVSSGEVHFLSLSDRVTAAPPHFGIAIEHISPPCVSEEMAEAICQASARAIEAIGMRDGIAYPQVIAGSNGPQVLEIAARIPGGHMREVALYRSGTDMIEIAILQALGHPDPLSACRLGKADAGLSVKFITELDFSGHAGRRLKAVFGLEESRQCPGVRLARMYLAAGQPLPPLDSSAARFGAIIATGVGRDEACARSAAAARQIRLEFEAR